MRIPISYCLGWPKRIFSGAKNIAIKDLSNMQFFEPDREKFKALKLSECCIENEMDTSIYLNASNEVAVDAFLSSQITFPEITDIVEEVLCKANFDEPLSIDDVKATDFRARQMALEIIRKWKS
jgi:1-deoxy-D-xylulose-5-phosphate reductoisomerase